MDVFISWSGNQSRQVAVALAEWLPAVLQRVKPFVSDKNIHSGSRWQSEVTGKLDTCAFGVLVVTADNQASPWLQFEAGALSKSVTDSRVVPLLIDLRKSDLLLPLNMFQAELLDRAGITNLLTSLNESTSDALDVGMVASLADMWWPKLEERMTEISAASVAKTSPSEPQRTERELLEEIVTMLRGMRNTSAQAEALDLNAERVMTSTPSKLDPAVTKASQLRRQQLVDQACSLLKDAGFPAKRVATATRGTIALRVDSQNVPDELADNVGQMFAQEGIQFWLMDGQGDLGHHYGPNHDF